MSHNQPTNQPTNKQTNKTIRQSNIELLRLVSMLLVLLVHSNYFSIGAPSTEDITQHPSDSLLRIFFQSASIICVNVFILISGWFGIRPTFKGISNFLFQCIFILSGIYLIALLLGTSELSFKGILDCFFANNIDWFIKAYLLLYIIAPILNAFVKTASRKEFKIVLLSFFLFVCTYCWIFKVGFMQKGYTTLFFIGLYLLARYISIYKPYFSQMSYKSDLLIYLGITIFTSAIILTAIYFGKHLPFNLYAYISPTTTLAALFFTLAFTKIRVQNNFINWCAISSFSVYLIHMSPSAVGHFREIFICLHNKYNGFTYWLFTFTILSLIFVISILIDKIRIKVWSCFADKLDSSYHKLKSRYNF